MGTMLIIIGEPSAKAGTQFRAGLEGVQMDAFVLHRPPEPLGEDIVHPASPTVHAYLDLDCSQHTGEGIGGEVATLMGIADIGLAETGQRLLQGLDAKAASMVFDSRQASTSRLAQSIMVTR
jgi:hypothetical protein